MLEVGSQLGPYEIVAPIGSGGMGEVYRARDTRLDRTVAIKVLPSEVAGDADLRARFEREARAIAALDHLSSLRREKQLGTRLRCGRRMPTALCFEP